MKAKALKLPVVLLFICCTLPLFGQNPLVGTWERATDSIRSVKIITPTHWMVFLESFKGDKTTFFVSLGGTYTLTGNKYIEHVNIASYDGYGKEKTDYTVQVEGDKFYQKGTLTLGDGRTVPIDEVWQKASTPQAFPDNPAVGSWNQVSASHTSADGKKETFTLPAASKFEIITPTHWMAISHHNNKFDHAFGGTYTQEGNKLFPVITFASFPYDKTQKFAITQKVTRGKRYSTGVITNADGQQVMTFNSVFQKIQDKPNGKGKLAKAPVSKSRP